MRRMLGAAKIPENAQVSKSRMLCSTSQPFLKNSLKSRPTLETLLVGKKRRLKVFQCVTMGQAVLFVCCLGEVVHNKFNNVCGYETSCAGL